jgi:hypothetical protein
MSIENRLRTCLRVRHPEVPLEELSELLGRPPQNFGVKGAIRGRTRDNSLVSTWKHNYWCADFTRGDDLEERVDEVFEALGSRADTFMRLMRETGAGAGLDVYLYLTKNVTLSLDAPRLARLGELGIELGFDLAPGAVENKG